MAKEKITFPIDDQKALSFEFDPENQSHLDFAEKCKVVAKTGPSSIQDFFVRLNEINRKQPNKNLPKAKNGRKP